MFCFLSSWSSLFNMADSKGFKGEEYNRLFKTSWIFPFFIIPILLYTQALAVLPSRARALFDCVALCSSPPPSWRVVGEAVISVQKWNTLPKACRQHILTSKPTLRSSPCFVFFLDVAKLLLSVWTVIPAVAHHVWLFFSSSFATTLGEKRVLSQPQANAPALFFLSSPCAVSLLSPPSFCKEWYKFTKKNWPDRKGHNWLPVQCATASCSVTLNNFSKNKKKKTTTTCPSCGWCRCAPWHQHVLILTLSHINVIVLDVRAQTCFHPAPPTWKIYTQLLDLVCVWWPLWPLNDLLKWISFWSCFGSVVQVLVMNSKTLA